MKILIVLCLASFLFSGCMVIWTDDVFIGTVFKSVDANDIDMISEPNYLQIGSGNSRTRNDNIKLKAVIGNVPVSLESLGPACDYKENNNE